VAEDYIYSIKRILDPKNRAPSVSFLDGKLLGADAVVAQAKKTGKFDYAAQRLRNGICRKFVKIIYDLEWGMDC